MVDQLNKLDSIQINVSCSPETENTLLKELFGFFFSTNFQLISF